MEAQNLIFSNALLPHQALMVMDLTQNQFSFMSAYFTNPSFMTISQCYRYVYQNLHSLHHLVSKT